MVENPEVGEVADTLHEEISRLKASMTSFQKMMNDRFDNYVIIAFPKNSLCARWIIKQVESGVYRNHNHAIETLILEKMKEKKERGEINEE